MRLSPKLIAATRWLLLGVAGFATLLAVVVVVENWRGDRAWAAMERELKARGEPLDYSALQPPPVPDEKNFFRTPALARILYIQADDTGRQKLIAELKLSALANLIGSGGGRRDYAKLRKELKEVGALAGPASASPVADIAEAMQPMQPLLDELRHAARARPQAALVRSPVPFGPPVFDGGTAFRLAQALGGWASVELELGRIDDAFADIFALQRFANGLTAHPGSLLQLLVGNAMHGVAAAAIDDGCQRHVWTDARLAEFQRQISEFHPIAGLRDAIRAERATGIYFVDARPTYPPMNPAWPVWWFHGWTQQNKVALCRRCDEEIFVSFSVTPERVFATPAVSPRPAPARQPRFYSPYEWLPRLALPNLGKITGSFAASAEQLRVAAVRWAIERFRIAHGRYPEVLDELVPTLLPTVPVGILGGQPFHYAALPGGGHQLYSLGWNGRDDGGKDDDIGGKLPDAR